MSPGDAPGNHQYCLSLIAVCLPASAHPAAFMSLRADVTRCVHENTERTLLAASRAPNANVTDGVPLYCGPLHTFPGMIRAFPEGAAKG